MEDLRSFIGSVYKHLMDVENLYGNEDLEIHMTEKLFSKLVAANAAVLGYEFDFPHYTMFGLQVRVVAGMGDEEACWICHKEPKIERCRYD